MGFSKKSQVGKGLDTDGRKWVIAGISIRASLKPVKTKLRVLEREAEAEAEEGSQHCDFSEEDCTTPTARETKIPGKLKCPPPPCRKRLPALRCRSNVVREYFTPPADLETVFIKRQVILKSFDS